MPQFDTVYPDNVGTFDFSKYVKIRALFMAKNWPLALVPLATIHEAFDDEDDIAHDWRPGEDELATAPMMHDWKFIDHTNRGQGIRLQGICTEHPVLRGPRWITTSHLVAMDLAEFTWVRTLSRWYRLERFAYE